MLDTILLIIILFFSIAGFIQAWIAKMMVADLRHRIKHRLHPKIEQIHRMNYNMLLKEGVPREHLNIAYPEISGFDD